MKWKWESLFRGYIGLLLLVLVWSVWRAAAQTGTGVEIIQPENGARFNPRSDIQLSATVGADLMPLKRVEFLLSGHVLGVVTNAPYKFIWSNAPVGSYVLTAHAVSENNTVVSSEPIDIGVYHALLTFGLNRVPVLTENRLFDIPLWQYCASLIYIFLAFFVSQFLDFLALVWLKRRANRSNTELDRLLMEMLKGPVKLLLFVVFLRIGLALFTWPLMVQRPLGKILTIVAAGAVTYMAMKFIDVLLGLWRRNRKPDQDRTFEDQLFPIIRNTLRIFAVVVAALVTLDNIGVNITAALASLSIGGLAIGLAAQDTLANMFGAVAIFVDKPFRIGDSIRLDAGEGRVENIGLRSTRVRNADGFIIAIPNKTMGNATIINLTLRPNIRTEMNLSLGYDLPAEKVSEALKILREVYGGHPSTFDLQISFNKFTSSALNIWVQHFWKGNDNPAYLAGIEELNLTLKRRFDAAGIPFASPTQTVYLKQDSAIEKTATTPAAASGA